MAEIKKQETVTMAEFGSTGLKRFGGVAPGVGHDERKDGLPKRT